MTKTCRDHLWEKTDDKKGRTMRSRTSGMPRTLHRRQKLQPRQVEAVIRGLENTGPSHDGLPNAYLKLCVEILVPYLEHIFGACLELSYIPMYFKLARTILLN